jgi:hypothetical protein
MDTPVKVLNVDGSKNVAGIVNSYATLGVKLGSEIRNLKFYLAELGEDCTIFGFPFLCTFNPLINWQTGKIGYKGGITVTQKQKRVTTVKRLQLQALKQCGVPPPGHTIYMRCTSFTQQWTAAAEQLWEHLTEATLPPEYQQHVCVFDQNLAAHFPPLRKENFAIQLKPDAANHLNCKVYPLNKKETGVLQQKIEEGLDKGQLEEGPTEFESPIFFIEKKEGKDLQLVVDYRKLNMMTVPDKYYMPDTQVKLDKLKGK